ncbi:MAG: hypothetical protein ACRC68_16940 [Clostridium sp.]
MWDKTQHVLNISRYKHRKTGNNCSTEELEWDEVSLLLAVEVKDISEGRYPFEV